MNAQMPKPPTPPSAANNGHKFKMAFRKPDLDVGHRVLVYGRPGTGKTTLMLKGLPRPLVAFDFDNSINILLQKPTEESGIDPTDIYLADVAMDAEGRLDYGDMLATLRDATVLQEDGKTRVLSENWQGVKSVLIDTGTFAERAIEPYMFEHGEKYPTGNKDRPKARSLADYAFRSGNLYKQDLFQMLLDYLANLAKCHVNVGIIYHTAVGKTPNLESTDGYALQYQPDSWVQGKTSLADTAMGWSDHVGYIKNESVIDKIVTGGGKDKKEKSVERFIGDATISFSNTGDHIGKSRTLFGEAATVKLDEFHLSMLGIK